MKNTKLVTSTALLTFMILCIAPPMASASELGFKASSTASFSVKTSNPKSRWWNKFRRGNFKKNGFNKRPSKAAPKASVDNPEPITGMLALAAAGVGGMAARKRKKNID